MSHSSNKRHQQDQSGRDEKRHDISPDHGKEQDKERGPSPGRSGGQPQEQDRNRDKSSGQQSDKRKSDPSVNQPPPERDAPGRQKGRDDDEDEERRLSPRRVGGLRAGRWKASRTLNGDNDTGRIGMNARRAARSKPRRPA